jgi:hypothetical protein
MRIGLRASVEKLAIQLAIFGIVYLMLQTGSAETHSTRNQDFSVFWQVFRKAALDKNWQMLEQMCHFPVTVKGVLDRDPVYHVSRQKFSRFFDRFLREGVFSPNEELEFIRKTPTLVDDGRPARRVDDMIFRRTDKGWLLDTFYMQYTSD